ncbi:MAG: hypothetical protein ACOC1G_03950, partial [Phycisphaeraceae bacterium]
MLTLTHCFGRMLAAAACVVLAVATASPVAGQDRLPASMLNATSLSSSQENEIEAFVSQWNTQLLQGSDSEITDAREALLQPVRSSASDAFLDQYGEAVGERLSTALEARRLITRLNAMIVAGELGGRGVRGVIVKGLSDPSPAVTYWAASGAARLAEARKQGARVSTSAVRDVIESLDRMLDERQPSNQLLYPSLRAAVAMDVPEGDVLFLDTLSRRVEVHANNPMLDYRPALQKGAWSGLIQRSITSRSAHGEDVLKQSAKLAARYLSLISGQLERRAFEDGPTQSHLDMMLWNQRLLATVNRFLEGPDAVPATREVEQAIEDLDVNFLRLAAGDWVATLQKRPYAI